MKKLLCLLAFVLSLVLAFGACNSTQSTPQPTESLTAALDDEKLYIVRDGISDFVIIFPKGDNEAYNSAKNIAKQINLKFGTKLEYKNDSVLRTDSSRAEILVGATNRPESQNALKKLSRINDYLCEKDGKKLVILGHSTDALQDAEKHFISKFVTRAEGKTLAFAPSDSFINELNFRVKLDSCAGNSLSDYTIIYPKNNSKGEYYVALSLREHLYSTVGLDIPVSSDECEPTKLEILIGNTNRNTAQTTSPDTFSVSVADGKLLISADSFYSYLAASKYLTYQLFSMITPPDTLCEGFSYSGNVSETAPAREGKYRVLFNNVWGLNTDFPYANRPNYASSFYLAYSPDVIALNEYWDAMRSEGTLHTMLEEHGYVELIPTAKEAPSGNLRNPKSNVLPIFYNPDRLKVVEASYTHLKWYKSDSSDELVYADDSKAIIIAVFEGLDENGNGNGERFIIANTHLTSNYMGSTHGYRSRLHNVEELWNAILPVTEKYADVSVLVGCDFNSRINSDEINKLLNYGFKSCHETADTKDDDNSIHSTPVYDPSLGFFTHGSTTSSTYSNGSIDHVFEYGSNIDAKLFDTLKTGFSATFSDHSPLLLDFDVVQSKGE